MYVVTFFPILLAAIVNMIIGYVWFHPRVFGALHMRLSDISPERAEQLKKRMPLMVCIGFVASMLVAYVMNYVGIAWGVYQWVAALELGFWCWAGFIAPSMLGMVLWEGKSFRLYLIISLYWLVSLMTMSLVLLFW